MRKTNRSSVVTDDSFCNFLLLSPKSKTPADTRKDCLVAFFIKTRYGVRDEVACKLTGYNVIPIC
jgi:hypothetical protein